MAHSEAVGNVAVASSADFNPVSASFETVEGSRGGAGLFAVGDVCPPGVGGATVRSFPCPAPRVALPIVEGVESAATSSELFPDEYLCDGGDQGLATSVAEDGTVVLQFEETVGTFLDESADRHVKPSTRVCVYAPSFGAVSSISQQVVDLTVDKLASAHDSQKAGGYIAPLALRYHEKTDTGLQATMRARPSELDVERADANVVGVSKVEKHIRTLNVFQEYGFQGDQALDGTTLAILHEGVGAAVAWQQNEAPIITGRTDALLQMRGRAVAREYFTVEDRRQEGDLRLIKTADVSSAKPGETVSFAIRYDNLGGKPVFDVTIIDHLSPRLELVEGSVKCDRLSEIIVEGDDEGSVYLKVRLAEALEPESGGVVTFECLVRP